MIEAVQLGTQDLVITSTGPVGNFVPETKHRRHPVPVPRLRPRRKVMDGPIGQDMLKKMPGQGPDRPGLDGERLPPHDQQQAADQHRPPTPPGLKVRTMENKVHMEGYKTFGLLPTPMAFPELFTALQQGTVDGQENPIPVILSSKFSQVQKHLSLTGHVYSPAVILLSAPVWNKLSDADKKVFVDAAKGAAVAQRKRSTTTRPMALRSCKGAACRWSRRSTARASARPWGRPMPTSPRNSAPTHCRDPGRQVTHRWREVGLGTAPLLLVLDRLTDRAGAAPGLPAAGRHLRPGLWQVVSRFVLSQPSTWTEEIMRRC
jgi:TRAP-type C4-dicarboxylate transport system substrate-binding protein